MKKIYVMFVNGIVGMGGGQMYVNNKIDFMESLGWDVVVFSGLVGKCVIKGLERFQKYIVSELVASPLIYSKDSNNKTIEYIIKILSNYETIVIESSNPHIALWGELLAKRLNCKHMVHLLDERNDLIVPKEYLDFYWFKYRRRELSGINRESLKMLFRYDSCINDSNSYFLPSLCTNVVVESDVLPEKCNLLENRITLGCIGRLEKEFVKVTSKAFVDFARKHIDKNFNVLFVGDSDNNKVKNEIVNLFGNLKNVNLILLGYLYPIPSIVFKNVDVFVSSAGSANVSYRNGCKTISIDGRDLCAIGVLGYTTMNSLNRKDEPKQDIVLLLEKILFSDYLQRFKFNKPISDVGLERLESHLEFLDKSSKNLDYFDVGQLKVAGKDRIKRLLRICFGKNNFFKIREMISRNRG